MWAWIRTPRGSTTTALVVAVVLALLWFDPWSRPLRHPFSLNNEPVPAPQAMAGNPPAQLLESAGSSATQPGSGSASVAVTSGDDVPRPAYVPAQPNALAATSPGPVDTKSNASSAPPASRPAGQPDPQAPGAGSTAPSGKAVTPSGPVAGPSGSAVASSGAATAPSGSAAAPSGSAAAPPAVAPGSAVASPADDKATLPGFDIVRVEPDGSAVIAGRGEPGSEVALLDGDRVVARAQVDATGQFALLPPSLDVGDHTLALQTKRSDRAPVRSAQSVAVSVARRANTRPLVALLSPDKPAEILSDGGTGEAVAGASASPAPVPLAIQSVEARQAGQFMTSGIAKPGTSNRVYLNGSFVAEVTAGPNGRWSVEVKNGMTPGRYNVRADQVDAGSGKVVSRVEVPFDYPDGAASDVPANRMAKAEPATRRQAVASAKTVAPGTPETAALPATVSQTAGPASSKAPPASPLAPSIKPAEETQATASGRLAVDPPVSPKFPAQASAESSPMAASGLPQGSASAVVPNLTTAIVSKGQSLWRISRKLLGRGVRYTEIYASNAAQIRDPALIYPGQVFVVATQRVN